MFNISLPNTGFSKEEVAKLSQHEQIRLMGYTYKAEDSDGKFDIQKSLVSAVMANDETLARFFIAHGADINANHQKNPLLILIVHGENEESVALALRLGADIEIQDKEGFTALHTSCYLGNQPITKLLLNNKANLEAIDNEGSTPLMMSARGSSSNIDLFKFLLECGANASAKNKNRLGARELALINDRTEFVSLIEDGYQKSFFESKKLENSIFSTEKNNTLSF